MKACDTSCQNAMMVAKRRSAGTYTWSEEQKQKVRESVKATYASRAVFTEAHREKFRETMKRNWREGHIDATNHWTKTMEGRARLSAMARGRKLGPQPKMSLGAQRRLRTKRETLYTSAQGGFRQDLCQYFRSNWEANFARILNLLGKRWTYEEKTFQLEPSLSYTPDFYVECENAFYELKGRLDEKSKRQLDLMRVKYPDIIVHLIDGVKYRELRLEYRDKVEWEGK